jgi:hypothetical protein
MSDAAPEPDRKVISFFTREAFVPPKLLGDTHAGADHASIELLEMVTNRFKAGELRGCVLLCGVAEEDGLAFVTQYASDTVLDFEQVFIGACTEASRHIMKWSEEELTKE